jgi:hypothetical protein
MGGGVEEIEMSLVEKRNGYSSWGCSFGGHRREISIRCSMSVLQTEVYAVILLSAEFLDSS